MTCTPVKLPTGEVAILCSRGPRPLGRCQCGAKANRLCDFPVGLGRSTDTCDKPLCASCAVAVGRGIDYCPDHPVPVGGQHSLAL